MLTRTPPNSGSSVPVVKLEVRFEVGKHVVRVSKVLEGRWVAAVDEVALSSSFRTQADAWEAGVREADRLDRTGPR